MSDHLAHLPHPVAWSSDGAGPAVVLLHGLGGDRGFWAYEISMLSADFRVIALDFRGSGGTPATTGGHSIADLADDVRAVLDSAGVDRADVIGFSMGGLVAESFAVRHPDRLRRLVLAPTYAVMNPQARMFLDAVRDVVVTTGSMRDVYPLVCPWLFSIGFLSDPANAAWLEAPEDDGEPPAGWLAQYQAQRDFDGREDLARVKAPALILSGGQDNLVAGTDAEFLAAGIRHARAHCFPTAGHLLNIEAAEAYISEVRQFLTAVDGDEYGASR